MKVLKPGFYIDRHDVIWFINRAGDQYRLGWWRSSNGKEWSWFKDNTAFMRKTRSRYLGV